MLSDEAEAFVQIVESRIAQAEDNAILEKNLEVNEEFRDQELFKARSKAVKAACRALRNADDYIRMKYPHELKYSKENIYPRAWMLKDEKISNVLERYPKTELILNYVFNLNRYIRGDEYKAMTELTERFTKVKAPRIDPDTREDHEFAVVLADHDFYERITRAVDCTKIYVQKYLQAFKSVSIFFELGKDEKNRRLYSDGYFVKGKDNTLRKVAFLRNDKRYRDALRSLPQLLRRG